MVVVEEKLEAALAASEMNWGELAVEMGVARQCLHRWKTGRKPWPPARVKQVARVLGVPVAAITAKREG